MPLPESVNNSSAESAGGVPPHGLEWRLINVLAAALISLAAFSVYELHSIFGKPLAETPELRVAVVARDMARSGDFVLPMFGGEPRLKKPPMPYWLAALSAKYLFRGATDNPKLMANAVQFSSAASAALAVFATMLFGFAFFGRMAGLMAGIVLASCELVMRFAQLGFCDSTLMMFTLVSAGCISRLLTKQGGVGMVLLGGLALGGAILTKGHIPVVFLALPVLAELIARRWQIGAKQYVYVLLMGILGLAVAAPWFVMVEQRHPGALHEMMSEAGDALRSAGPAAETTHQGHRQNDRWTYYFYKGAAGLLPWSILILAEVLALVPLVAIRNKKTESGGEHLRFFSLLAFSGFILLLFADKKQDYYLLPLIPAFALAFAAWHSRMNTPGGFVEERMAWAQLIAGCAGALLFASAPWWPGAIAWLQSHDVARVGYVATHAGELSAKLGTWAILLALAFLLLNYVFARRWIDGRGHWVIFIFGSAALLASAAMAALPSERSRNAAGWNSVSEVNTVLSGEMKDAMLFAPGLDDAMVLFYTGHKAHSVRELADDASRNGTVVLLRQGDSLKNAAKAFGFKLSGLAEDESPGFSLLKLKGDAPQLEDMRTALKAWEKPKGK